MFDSARTALKTFGFGRARHVPAILPANSPATSGEHDREAADSFACYVCDSPMSLVADVATPEFGVPGLRRHEMRCDICGMLADRIYHHAIGYDRTLVL